MMRDTEQHNAETAKRASPSCECPCDRCRELGCGLHDWGIDGLTEAESSDFLAALAELRPTEEDA